MSDTWDMVLTKQFRDRDNKEQVSATIGTIISVNPMSISLYNGKVILNNKQIIVCNSLLTINANIVLNNVAEYGTVTTECIITNTINNGDKVLCLPTSDGQTFFILDKVVV